jgi:LPXTG-site transpeptidase (sortase) family protein
MTIHPDQTARQSAKPGEGRKRQSGLLWFERISLVSGLALLLAFGGIRIGQNEAGNDGLEAFYQQLHAAEPDDPLPVNTSPVSTELSSPGAGIPAVTGMHSRPPEFGLWSEKRIHQYQQSLLQEAGPPLGVLRIERLDIEVPVYNGTDEFVLNRGVGRIEGTARIDGNGNLGIAGHRDGFFRGLKDIQAGDVLELQTIRGAVRYRVGSTVIVDPSDVSVLAPTRERVLTLVTCYPFYFVGHAPKRFIVQATAVSPIAMN